MWKEAQSEPLESCSTATCSEEGIHHNCHIARLLASWPKTRKPRLERQMPSSLHGLPMIDARRIDIRLPANSHIWETLCDAREYTNRLANLQATHGK